MKIVVLMLTALLFAGNGRAEQAPEQYLESLFLRGDTVLLEQQGEPIATREGASLESRAWFVTAPQSGRNFFKAFSLVEGMKAEAPDDPWTLAARTHFTGDLERAIALCEKASSTKGAREDVLWLCTRGVSKQVRSAADGEQVKGFLERNRSKFEGTAAGLVAEADALQRINAVTASKSNSDETAALYERALRLDPANELALYGRFKDLTSHKKYDEAVALYLHSPGPHESQVLHWVYWSAVTNLDLSKDEQARRIEADARALIDRQEPSEIIVQVIAQYLRDRSAPRLAALLERIQQRYPASKAAEMALLSGANTIGAGINVETAFPEVRRGLAKSLVEFLKRPDRKSPRAEALAAGFIGLLGHYTEISSDDLLVVATHVEPDNALSAVTALADRKAHLPDIESIAAAQVETLVTDAQENGPVLRYDSRIADYNVRSIWEAVASWEDALGWIYLQQGRIDLAELKLGTALRMLSRREDGREAPLNQDLGSLLHLGYLQAAKGRYQTAEEYFARAMSVEYPYPDDHPALAAYRNLYLAQHGNEQGLESYMRAAYETERSGRKKLILKKREKEPVPIHAFKMTSIGGQEVSSAGLKGKVAVINFWGTWCGPCVAEMPGIQKLYDKYKDDPDVTVLTVAVSDSPSRVKTFMAEKKFSFPVLMEGDYTDEARILGFPTTWFLNRDGARVFAKSGSSKRIVEEFTWRIEALLEESRSSSGEARP